MSKSDDYVRVDLRKLLDQKDSQGNTELHKVAITGNLERAQELVEMGAKLDIKNKAGRTPKEEAIANIPSFIGSALGYKDTSPVIDFLNQAEQQQKILEQQKLEKLSMELELIAKMHEHKPSDDFETLEDKEISYKMPRSLKDMNTDRLEQEFLQDFAKMEAQLKELIAPLTKDKAAIKIQNFVKPKLSSSKGRGG